MSEQPMPQPNTERPVVEYAVEWLQDRAAVGRERYGTPLQPHNGRDFGRDADEEIVDFFLYWVGHRIETGKQIRRLYAMIGELSEELKTERGKVKQLEAELAAAADKGVA